ncbi:MAG: phasin family protein [Pseudomonadota bacterium]
MAKANKKSKKAKAKKVGQRIEAQSLDMAHKIWLAGVGAYGKAYDVALDGAGKVTVQTSDVFDELVKRGETIEDGMKQRLASNSAFTKLSAQIVTAGKQIAKLRKNVRNRAGDVTETVGKFQDEQRERLEARMERMREALGLKGLSRKAKSSDKVHAKLDELEERVAELRASTEGADDAVRARVERLSDEIAAVGGKTKPKKAKKAKKVKKANKAKAKSVAAEAAPAPTVEETVEVPATDAQGRLEEPVGKADDLKVIKGVGPVLERKLFAAGIFHYWQIAALDAGQIESLETDMSFPGRIARDNWVQQADELAAQLKL